MFLKLFIGIEPTTSYVLFFIFIHIISQLRYRALKQSLAEFEFIQFS